MDVIGYFVQEIRYNTLYLLRLLRGGGYNIMYIIYLSSLRSKLMLIHLPNSGRDSGGLREWARYRPPGYRSSFGGSSSRSQVENRGVSEGGRLIDPPTTGEESGEPRKNGVTPYIPYQESRGARIKKPLFLVKIPKSIH